MRATFIGHQYIWGWSFRHIELEHILSWTVTSNRVSRHEHTLVISSSVLMSKSYKEPCLFEWISVFLEVTDAYSLTTAHTHSPQPTSSRMLWITVHLCLGRSQGPTALDRIRQQSGSTVSLCLIFFSSICQSFFSSLFAHCLLLSFLHLLRSFSSLSSTRQACSLFTLALSPPSVFLYSCLFHFSSICFLSVYFTESSVSNCADLFFSPE